MGAVPPPPVWNRPQHAPYAASRPQGQGEVAVTAGAGAAGAVRGRVLRRDMGPLSPTLRARRAARHVDARVDGGPESPCSEDSSE